MSENVLKTKETEKLSEKTHWYENAGGEWFFCFTKRKHGEKKVIKIAVAEIIEKTAENA